MGWFRVTDVMLGTAAALANWWALMPVMEGDSPESDAERHSLGLSGLPGMGGKVKFVVFEVGRSTLWLPVRRR